MKTKIIKVVTFGADQLKDKEISINETCVFCSNPAIAGIYFPEPYKVKGSDDLEFFGDVCFCEEHLRKM